MIIEPTWITGTIQIVLLVILCISGLHVFVGLGILAVSFSILYLGWDGAVLLLGMNFYSRACAYHMAMLPLFILMGTVVAEAGIGKDAFDSIMMWLGKLKGGLAIVSVFAGALFGAVTGQTTAIIVTIGGIAIPEMTRHGYSKPLRTGVIASSGMLAALIPPSIGMILISMFTDVSVGKLLIAGIVPGIILAVMYAIIIYVWVSLRPDAAPTLNVTFSWRQRFAGLRLPGPLVIIFLFIIGGIYFGIFSPTEAAGIGASFAIIFTLILRRLNWLRFRTAITTAARLMGMMGAVLAGGFVFAQTIFMSGISTAIGDWLMNAGIGIIGTWWIIIAIQIAAGCVLNLWAMMILFIPLFFPIMTDMGFDPVQFGVMTLMLLLIAELTPPIAQNIYMTQLMDPECQSVDVIKGVIPFYIGSFALLVMLLYIPALSLWLPNMMY